MQTIWDELSTRLTESTPFRELEAELGEIVRLPPPAAGWVFDRLARRLGRRLLVVVPSEAEAMAWSEGAALTSGEEPTVTIPSSPLTPYRDGGVSLSTVAREVLLYRRLADPTLRAVVTTPRLLFQRLPPRRALLSRVIEIAPGEDHRREALVARLSAAGYRRVELVHEVGDFAVRGGIVDLFAPDADAPLRLDLFGDTVESIRRFEPESQRSEERLDGVTVSPMSLFPVDEAAMEALASRLAELAPSGAPMEMLARIDDLRHRRGFEGWVRLLPAALETVSLKRLLGEVLVVVVAPQTVLDEADDYADHVVDDYRARRGAEVLPPPEELLLPRAEVEALIGTAEATIGALEPGSAAIDFGGVLTDELRGQLPRLPREVEGARRRGERFVVVAQADHVDQLRELLEERFDDGDGEAQGSAMRGVEFVPGELGRGFRLPPAAVTVFAESQLFTRRRRSRRGHRARYGPFVSGLRDLQIGDFVVHVDHGIGRFDGLQTMETVAPDASIATTPSDRSRRVGVEVMEISYAGGRKLLLPLSRIGEIQRYSGIEGAEPKLDTLGGTSWNRTKSRVRKSMRRLAIDLLKLYAEREVAEAPAMDPADDLMRRFAAEFAFEETEDQLVAIEEIESDLERSRPMDRLLAGDVGFGKTEVAMRAAFKVVASGYQVAVLAPTTILADQHLTTFRERYAGFPVTIDMVSRFRSNRQIRVIRERAAAGEIDVLIGTHRLLSGDIELPKLALLVVDEEQRFGVAQKERLRDLKTELHVLAMSATPVPRTLQLSLAGVRDLSTIETPPRDRMAVETMVLPFSRETVAEAIEFERDRGGQVYFVHNRVEDIDRLAAYVRELVPEVTVTVGHGQMDEAELARRMHAFTAGEYDVLVATTIIENGIHIPRVNTMLVHRADRFGLAQLYQLRGRVGRSSELGYCYLLVPGEQTISRAARQRLEALRDFSELGSGFLIAARDLEIRGAGNLLGPEQSGHIAAVGIETYMKMLEETIKELKGETTAPEVSATIDLPVAMSIPQDYVADQNLRLEVYRKITDPEVPREELLAELADRFGDPPPTVHELLEVAEVQRLASQLRVQSVSWRRGELVFRLRHDTELDPERLVELVADEAGAAFSPDGVLTLDLGDRQAPGAPLEVVRRTLERLAS